VIRTLDKDRLTAAFHTLEKRADVERLMRVLEIREKPGLASDRDYQKNYNGYYKLIRRKQSFYEAYYAVLENAASAAAPPSLSLVLQELYKKTGERHLSFGSKLCATLDDTAVIFDKYVASFFKVPNSGLPRQNWLPKALDRYERIKQGIHDFTRHEEWPGIRSEFDLMFPQAKHLPDVRVADLVVWADVGP
jgi:hypothetical protein